MGHIWVMTTTSAIGLMGIFLVDFIDMLFLSMLGSADILAGIGFAGSISFFTVSLSIGITISMAALVSRMIGRGDTAQAKRYVINVAVLALLLTSTLALIIWINLPVFFGLLGASGEPLAIGVSYLKIVLPSLPILATGMALSAALRAVGDAKLAMYTTLLGGLVNAVLDPIFNLRPVDGSRGRSAGISGGPGGGIDHRLLRRQPKTPAANPLCLPPLSRGLAPHFSNRRPRHAH